MRSVNKVILIGNLTRDPEMRQTPNGQQVCTFGIATNRQWTAKDGAKHSSAEFHELVAWARLAEICGSYLKKGKLIYIEGYLKTRAWDTPEGIRRHKTEVIIQDMIMLEKKDNIDIAYPENETEIEAPTPIEDTKTPSPDEETEAEKAKPIQGSAETGEPSSAETESETDDSDGIEF